MFKEEKTVMVRPLAPGEEVSRERTEAQIVGLCEDMANKAEDGDIDHMIVFAGGKSGYHVCATGVASPMELLTLLMEGTKRLTSMLEEGIKGQ